MAKNRKADTKPHAILLNTPGHTQNILYPPPKKLPEGLNPVGFSGEDPSHVTWGRNRVSLGHWNFRNPFERQGKEMQKKVKFPVTVQESKMLPTWGGPIISAFERQR